MDQEAETTESRALQSWSDLWAVFSESEREELLDSLATWTRTKRFPAQLFSDRLGEMEGRAQSGSAAGHVKITYRKRSADDIRRAIKHFREQIFNETTWRAAIVNYFTTRKVDLLCPVLDAFDVAHDAQGRATADVVAPTTSRVREITNALVEEYGARPVFLLLAALKLHDHHWSFLESELSTISRFSRDTSGALNRTQPTSETVAPQSCTETNTSLDIHQAIASLELQFKECRESIEEVLRNLDAGQVPRDPGVSSLLARLRDSFQVLATELLPVEYSLESLRAATHDRETKDHIVGIIAKCKRLRHMRETSSMVVQTVHDEAHASIARFSAMPSGELNQACLLAPFQALVDLVERADELDEQTTSQHTETISKAFGYAIVGALMRRTLEFVAEPSQEEEANAELISQESPVDEVMCSPPSQWHEKSDQVESNEVFVSTPAENEASFLGVDRETLDEHEQASAPGSDAALIQLPEIREREATSDEAAREGTLNQPDQPEQAARANKPEEHFSPSKQSETPPESHPTSTQPQGLPRELASFETYATMHWVNERGVVERAPWEDQGFDDLLHQASERVLRELDLPTSYLFSLVTTARGRITRINPADLESVGELLDQPDSPIAGTSSHRQKRIADQLARRVAEPGLPLSLFIEALRPSSDGSINPGDFDRLVDLAAFGNKDLGLITRFLLRCSVAGLDAIPLFRQLLASDDADNPQELQLQLKQECEEFRRMVSTLWSAAGGKIQTTHSRKAWTEFMQQEIQEIADILGPTSGKTFDIARWDQDSLRNKSRKLWRNYAHIVDVSGVAMKDRKAADKAARDLVDKIGHILSVADRMRVLTDNKAKAPIELPLEQARHLLTLPALANPIEEICRKVFLSITQPKVRERVQHSLYLSLVDVLRCPDVISQIPPDILKSVDAVKRGIPIPSLINRLRAACYLLRETAIDVDEKEAEANFIGRLRRTLIDNQRSDLLACLNGSDVLDANEETRLHREAGDLVDSIYTEIQVLERDWRDAEELLAPVASQLGEALDQVRRTTDGAVQSNSMHQNFLLREWVRALQKFAAASVGESLNAYRALAIEKDETIAAAIRSCLDERRYREIPLILGGSEVSHAYDSTSVSLRRTLWRSDALTKFTTPIKYLVGLSEDRPELTELVEAWGKNSGDAQERTRLRRLFYEFISGESGSARGRLKRVFPENLREIKQNKIVITCAQIRKMFRNERINPTFLPQLAHYENLILMSPPPSGMTSSGAATNWTKSVAAEQDTPSLIVFLAPQLPVSRRDEILREFRRRPIDAAIIDDVDLCRLATAEGVVGQDFVPFMELVLEKLSLATVSPYSIQDGQHVQLEMFVGRQSQAEKLARTAEYTRVFSGRKLGKSAMLKYVSVTADGKDLPSKNKLHVLFITIAGGDSERWIVDQIITEMHSRFGLSESDLARQADYPERLSSYINEFVRTRPTESLLIILDEADAFIEGQLREYDQRREGCLSFKMMKELPTKVDSNGLPRVRIVFSGYRVTNTREGVWANAGDVLRLLPLSEEEAISMVQGPLARIGIDARDQAAYIARRCGFQPAVLIRFGDCLVKRLQRQYQDSMRESIKVRSEDVVSTFNDAAVIDEIRTVVNNNFQGNRPGSVIFGATLLACKDLAPGYSLLDAPSAILKKIREIDGNTDWLERIDPNLMGEIQRNLQDFMDRELMVATDTGMLGDKEYRLKFPHYLPVLTQQSDVQAQVRGQIQALRETPQRARHIASILSESALDNVRYALGEGGRSLCRLVTVGGHWIEPLSDPKGGLPDRLGIRRDAVCEVSSSSAASRRDQVIPQVYIGITEEAGIEIIGRETKVVPLFIGGIDLLRWSLQQDAVDPDQHIEVIGLRRVTEARVQWWFEGVRALHFEKANAVREISKATSGIPILLRAFDRALSAPAATEVSVADFNSTLGVFEDRKKAIALELCGGSSSVRLSKRELEIARMVAVVARANRFEGGAFEFKLDEALDREWDVLYGELLPVSSLNSSPSDDIAVKVLMLSGLVPIDDQRHVRLVEGDPFLQLADLLEPEK